MMTPLRSDLQKRVRSRLLVLAVCVVGLVMVLLVALSIRSSVVDVDGNRERGLISTQASTEVIAIGTIALAVLTFVTILVGWFQLKLAGQQQATVNTLTSRLLSDRFSQAMLEIERIQSFRGSGALSAELVRELGPNSIGSANIGPTFRSVEETIKFRIALQTVLNFHEYISGAVLKGALDNELIFTIFGTSICRAYDYSKVYIIFAQNGGADPQCDKVDEQHPKPGAENVYGNFVQLAQHYHALRGTPVTVRDEIDEGLPSHLKVYQSVGVSVCLALALGVSWWSITRSAF